MGLNTASDRAATSITVSFIDSVGRGAVTAQEAGIIKPLLKQETCKASGLHRPPNRVLKELALELARILCSLYNQSLTGGTLPKDWIHAFIPPLFKKGNVHEARNYVSICFPDLCGLHTT